MKAAHLQSGRWAETFALEKLKRQGLNLRQRNFNSRFGEIDLIMEDKSDLVFVEVRYRRSIDFLHPAESISMSKQKKLLRTAQYYLSLHKHDSERNCRFDALLVWGERPAAQYEWIQHAFELPAW